MNQKANMIEYQIKTRSQMRRVDVIFIKDEDIEDIIISKKEFDKQKTKLKSSDKAENSEIKSEKKTPKLKPVKRKIIEDDEIENKKPKTGVEDDDDDIELALAALESGEFVPLEDQKPTSLFDPSEDVSAKNIYSFKTSKNNTEKDGDTNDNNITVKCNTSETPKANKILKIKKEDEAPSSSKSSKSRLADIKSCLKTPTSPKRNVRVSFPSQKKKIHKKDNAESILETPQENIIEEEQATLDNGRTPYSLRKRYVKDIKKIQKILEGSVDGDFSESDSEYEDSETGSNKDDSEEEEIVVTAKPVRRKLVQTIEKDKNRNGKGIQDIKISSDYFEIQSRKTKTSSNSFSKLKLTQEKIEEIYKNMKTNKEHETSIKNLLKEYTSLFEKWEFILEENYNLLLYGIGSKKDILSQFSKRFLNKWPVLVVNGYFPSLTIKEIVDNIAVDILKIHTSSNIQETIDLIGKSIKDTKILMVVNNIDGSMLRSKKCQFVLSCLAKLNNIHMIASVDHTNVPTLWDQSTFSDFNWIWWDCTSYLDYTEETVYESNILLQNTKGLTISSLRNVFNSLTKNSKNIFLIILKRQLENCGNTSYVGISFKDLYRESRKELLITSDIALRSQLKEFLDHLILKQKRNAESEECFFICVDDKILKEFMEEQS